MSGYQLHLPDDGEWHTTKITPASGWEVNFKSGDLMREPLIGWLTQVKAVGVQGTSGTKAVSRVVPGVLYKGEIVNAAGLDGFGTVTQI